MQTEFDGAIPLRFLGLPADGSYTPDPKWKPMEFLKAHLRVLPPHIASLFSRVTTARQRSALPLIRNRRLKYAQSEPSLLSFDNARHAWPSLWEGRERRGMEEGRDETSWVLGDFLEGSTQHVGRLAQLLGGYEEEREAERVREIRREAAANAFVPEEDDESDSDSDENAADVVENMTNLISDEDARNLFERRIREKFIYGLLENASYDRVDWDESWDQDNDRDAEERWFDEDDEE
ncbi:hypothetical protein CYLTODRAFT_396208 [Cylindrobasidium torrendii FP15055 ss-10]|uniref:CCD97-like C-terminal domain-containing protein n=1 Tax=Cylindrobasidium torrendii FP15055 ss-10 TaxID=1314674 RepID=A0A0D7BED8_9AGAR|nr:hypothetical protein CYLTODRAFT_396208 [Cylindrobasidium torrendii FP15055 ss-10]